MKILIAYIAVLYCYKYLKVFPMFKAKRDTYPFWAYLILGPAAGIILLYHLSFFLVIDTLVCNLSHSVYERLIKKIYAENNKKDLDSILIHICENVNYRQYLTPEQIAEYKRYKENKYVK